MAGLLDALRQYISDSMPGGSLNPEQPAKLSGLLDAGKKQAQYIGGLLDPNSPISQDAQNWHKRTQIGLADQLAGRQTPAAEYAHQQMMNMAGLAPIGLTVWHASPYKFNKFDMSKIGTGEGAQAYGHGLYTAEAKPVAQEYFEKFNEPAFKYREQTEAGARVKRKLADKIESLDPERAAKLRSEADSVTGTGAHMYKVDIPDEAVSRFLDWDKPLSQQAPEVRQAITKLARSNEEVMAALQNGGMGDMKGNLLYANLQDIFTRNAKRNAVIGGEDAAKWTHDDISRMANGNDAFATQQLQQYGIPGIRYLDGLSRPKSVVDDRLWGLFEKNKGDIDSTLNEFMRGVHNTPAKKEAQREYFRKQLESGRTSNYVLFSDQLPRILERNGVPTGLQPWKPGEWK